MLISTFSAAVHHQGLAGDEPARAGGPVTTATFPSSCGIAPPASLASTGRPDAGAARRAFAE